MTLPTTSPFFEAQLVFYTSAEHLAYFLSDSEGPFIIKGLEIKLPVLTDNACIICDSLAKLPDCEALWKTWMTTRVCLDKLCLGLDDKSESRNLVKAIYLLAAITWEETAFCSVSEALRQDRCVTMHPSEAVVKWMQWPELGGCKPIEVLQFIERIVREAIRTRPDFQE